MSADVAAEAHAALHEHTHEGSWNRNKKYMAEGDEEVEDENIAISLSNQQAERTVAPFLARHIPQQYNPLGGRPDPPDIMSKGNTKYCYRHHPDLKCRKQANEPSMEQLQNELGALSQSDQQGIAHVWSLFSAAPSKHRKLILQGILTQCCFPQLSFISGQVRDLIKIDFLSALPTELAFNILCFLDTTSLCKAAQVSQRWRALAEDDVVWHRMCEQHIDRKCTKCGWGLPLLERKRLRKNKRQIQMRAAGRGLNEWSPNITPAPEDPIANNLISPESSSGSTEKSLVIGKKRAPTPSGSFPEGSGKKTCLQSLKEDDEYFHPPSRRPWKDVYKDRFKVGINWKYGRYKTQIFRGHRNGVTCLQVDDTTLVTGSYDSTIKVWNVENGEELQTLRGHTMGIRCLQFDETKLFSGGMDGKVIMWDWKSGKILRVLVDRGHPSKGFVGLHFDGEVLAAGNMDGTIFVWDFGNATNFLLKGHTDWTNSVRVDAPSRTLFSASDDRTARLWDLNTQQTVRVYEGHVGHVQQVLPLPREYDIEDLTVDNAAETHSDVSAAQSTSTYDWALPNTVSQIAPMAPPPVPVEHPPHELFAPNSSRQPPPRYILTGSLDACIRLWDVQSALPIRSFFGHLEGVWALAADTLRFVSGAEDGMVKEWDPRTGQCLRTYTKHSGPVTCVGLSDERLVSGSEDCEVRVACFL
ncbi:F-box/WD repeat-containing protein pof1 [Patellaria atrata CBS 101060]|uniref:F-box/WD repeat-containing protein pof1 n=1 Tax=Patellaria atrata CBS 101060 TaxID=1346257 RepID=A0A9P4S338_9PEZI|nr:F-box/WD repeat-containing protein pof1 [Patellaria atrata CBS 101060]